MKSAFQLREQNIGTYTNVQSYPVIAILNQNCFSMKIASQLSCLLYYHICLFPLPPHLQLDPHFSFSAMTGEEKTEARRVLSKNLQDYLLGWHLACKAKVTL